MTGGDSDAGVGGSTFDAGVGDPSATESGCSCDSSGSNAPNPWALLGLLGLVGLRRRRR